MLNPSLFKECGLVMAVLFVVCFFGFTASQVNFHRLLLECGGLKSVGRHVRYMITKHSFTTRYYFSLYLKKKKN